MREDSGAQMSHQFMLPLEHRVISEVHKITYLHPAGVVSYAMIRPPSKSDEYSSSSLIPILVCLHGAGIDADSDPVSHGLDEVADLRAWILIPSGVTSWCGDDWHTWGWADVEAAITAIPTYVDFHGWDGPGSDANRMLLLGHSNGGQGVWYGLLHHPERIVGAAIVSGYASIQKYVPYSMWQETDPSKSSAVQAGLSSYRHELLLGNAQGTPIFVQHCSDDDNVPVFHSRRMNQLANLANVSTEYSELRKGGHWFDGILVTEGLKNFYDRILANDGSPSHGIKTFSITIANPADFGFVHGFQVRQLLDPARLGQLRVDKSETSIAIAAWNVQAFSLPLEMTRGLWLCIDGLTIDIEDVYTDRIELVSIDGDRWSTVREGSIYPVSKRRGKQLGNINAILKSSGPTSIVNHSVESWDIASQMARNLYQYFAADARFLDSPQSTVSNLISVGIGADTASFPQGFPIKVSTSAVRVITKAGQKIYEAGKQGLAAIFILPHENDRLELVVWGCDLASLRAAARLVPLIPGAGQPDFVILTRKSLYKGVDGVLGLGFFDSQWHITGSSVLT